MIVLIYSQLMKETRCQEDQLSSYIIVDGFF